MRKEVQMRGMNIRSASRNQTMGTLANKAITFFNQQTSIDIGSKKEKGRTSGVCNATVKNTSSISLSQKRRPGNEQKCGMKPPAATCASTPGV